MIYVFGGVPRVHGRKLLFGRGRGADPEREPRASAAALPAADRRYHGALFTVKDGRLCATPLFLVLVVVEVTDVVFARRLDPRDLRHHRDPFIVFTSNIFAILGLRALYFLLAG